jgi:NTP pyrophosphatase (non-canonical NTP hydrolase)
MVSLTESLSLYTTGRYGELDNTLSDTLTTGSQLNLQANYLECLEEFQNTLTNRLTKEELYDKVPLQKLGNILTEESEDNFNRLDLCQELIEEEVYELIDEIESKSIDPEKILKELCDVLYLLFGFASKYKELKFLPEAFLRVHSNNMLKLENGTIRGDGKLVKSPDHPKPDLSDLVEKGLKYEN